MNNLYLYLDMWLVSYRKNQKHALRDAHKNLKGFTNNFKTSLELFSVDYAFGLAVKNTLKQAGVN